MARNEHKQVLADVAATAKSLNGTWGGDLAISDGDIDCVIRRAREVRKAIDKAIDDLTDRLGCIEYER